MTSSTESKNRKLYTIAFARHPKVLYVGTDNGIVTYDIRSSSSGNSSGNSSGSGSASAFS